MSYQGEYRFEWRATRNPTRAAQAVAALTATIVLSAAGCSATGGRDVDDGPAGSTRAALTADDVPLVATELLGRPTDHSVTVNAVAGQSVQAYFEYGTVSGVYTGSTTVANFADGIVEAVMAGLNANTRYYYRMRYRPTGSSEQYIAGTQHSFRTQRSRTDTFTFAVQSDSHQGYDDFYSDTLYGITQQNILAGSPDFLIDLGDAFSLDDATETQATVRQKYLDQRAYFDMVAHSIPVFLVLGNHENEEGWNLDDMGSNIANSLPVLGANARKRYFLNPVPDAFYTGNEDTLSVLDGDKLREDYYAFEWGNALFVAIDPFWYTTRKPFAGTTGGEKNDEVVGNRWDWTLGREQYLWLKQTLESSTATFKFVFAHQLAGGSADYSRGGALAAKYCEWGGYDTNGTTWGFGTQRPGWEMPIHQLFVQTGVTAFFHGHDHVFVKETLDDVVYQEVPHAANDNYGTGFAINPTSYAGSTLVPNSGHVRVTVAPTTVNVAYVRSFLPGDGVNGTVAASYEMGSCAGLDSDGDGVDNCQDGCPTDPNKTAPGQCGCGVVDTDTDGDTTANCVDGCPNDPLKIAVGVCGCGVLDTDADRDGTIDCLEAGCTGATLVSNDADSSARIGTAVRFTAGVTCADGTPTYQYRLLTPSGVWSPVRAYSTVSTFRWVTTRYAAGAYTIEVRVRRSGSSEPYETSATVPFTLTR